jgi:hypothetical protein
MSNVQAMRVSDQHRLDNLRAIRLRDKWKKDYNAITNIIRECKSTLADSHRVGDPGTYDLEVILRVFRSQANFMLEYRDIIKQELRETAYPYV